MTHSLKQLYAYFRKFAIENDITEEYIDKAFERVRHPDEVKR